MIADVALPVPGLPPLTYRFPGPEPPLPGMRVVVPLGKRAITGVVVPTIPTANQGARQLKTAIRILDDEPALPPDLLDLGRWLGAYYHCTWGEALAAMLPGPFKPAGRLRFRLADPPPAGSPPGGLAGRLLERLAVGQPLARTELLAGMPATAARRLAELERDGWVGTEWRLPGRRPAPVPAALESGEREVPLEPSPEQAAALDRIRVALDAGGFHPFLLHGVTGSGKTEIYLQAMARTLELGRGAILLVPEISLTPQTCRRIVRRFGEQVAVLHSGLTPGQRADAWQRLRRGHACVALGARSAVFAPVRDLGLVVVDEEYETSYKQEDAPRYHARDVAAVRAKAAGAVLLLGSATPSVEAYHLAQQGRYTLLELPRRVDGRTLPDVRVVDLAQEPATRQGPPLFSRELLDEIQHRLERREQTILFLNRRGFAPVVLCPDCRYVVVCPDCSASLVYHRLGDRLRCHSCGRAFAPRPACPRCGAACVRLAGAGTQRAEEELAGFLPSARIVRLDQDAARRRGALEEVLDRFGRGEADILIGTQMVAKGMHFPHVTLVGVLNADTALHVPDFRAEERAFQLIVQVAGRAGRGGRPGLVLVQTLQPERPVIALAQAQDYPAFFAREVESRRSLGYPPFSRLALVVSKSRSREEALALAERASRRLCDVAGTREQILGPAPAIREREAKDYRFSLLIKSPDVAGRTRLLDALDDLRPVSGARLTVDVDPLQMA